MIDKLISDIKEKKSPIVVGLDPTLEMMPDFLKNKYFEGVGRTPDAVGMMFMEFNRSIINAVADLVPAVKPQIAMYERFGLQGLTAYVETCRYARQAGLTVIGDIKRGDISSTAAAYAAHTGGTDIDGELYDLWNEDAVTLNPYMGSDGITPFLDSCRRYKKGLFILVKTSNPSSSELEDLIISEPESGAGGQGKDPAAVRRVYDEAGRLTAEWGKDLIGSYGYSEVGAVVGATHKAQGEALRKALPHTFFLVPGYGAQGAGAEDVAGFFDEKGLGAIINSSRGITQAYKKSGDFKDEEYALAARQAVIRMREDLTGVINL